MQKLEPAANYEAAMQRIRELRAQGKTPAMVDIGYELFVEYDDDAATRKTQPDAA